MNPIRVMIADDHDSVRRGLSMFLRAFEEMVLVGAAINGCEAVNLCAKLNPDVILMDVLMPEMDGIAATRLICQHNPNIRVIALTSQKDPETFEAMLQAGAVGFLLKSASIDELASAIFKASKAETY